MDCPQCFLVNVVIIGYYLDELDIMYRVTFMHVKTPREGHTQQEYTRQRPYKSKINSDI